MWVLWFWQVLHWGACEEEQGRLSQFWIVGIARHIDCVWSSDCVASLLCLKSLDMVVLQELIWFRVIAYL
jgi:hypothetical protein